MQLSDAWTQEADKWARWAREPEHDSYWQFHGRQFFELLPKPGGLVLDVGCGEGRVSRDLKQMGYEVLGVDVAEPLVNLAREADPEGDYRVANAARLPLPDASVTLAVAFMSLHDMDDLDAAVLEIARVLKPGGELCMATVHPLNSAGRFAGPQDGSAFVIEGSYLAEHRTQDTVERNGLEMTFHSQHRPLQSYSLALEKAGLLIRAIREHAVPDSAALRGSARHWQRLPLFLHMAAVKPATWKLPVHKNSA